MRFNSTTPRRQSARLQEIEIKKLVAKTGERRPLLSPSTSESRTRRKGERALSPKSYSTRVEKHNLPFKKRKTSRHVVQNIKIDKGDPVAYWASTGAWPAEFTNGGSKMSSEISAKRRSNSTHRTDRLERMEENGISMMVSNLIRKQSRQMCDRLLEGDRAPVSFPVWPAIRRPDVMERVQSLPEGRI